MNTGIGNFPGNHTKDECFAECQKMRNKLSTKMTGCEHKHGIECHYHTKPIAKGNGREGSTCCVFEHKTKDIQYVNKLLDKVFAGKHKNDNKLKSFLNDLS